MRRYVTTITLVLALSCALAAPAGATHSGPDRVYQRYAKIRVQLIGCALDRALRHLGTEVRRRCPRLRRRYTLYSRYGILGTSFFICKTRRCPKGPLGVPNPRGRPDPRAVRIYG